MANRPDIIILMPDQMRDRLLSFIANTQVRMPRGPGAPLEQDPKTPLPYRRDED